MAGFEHYESLFEVLPIAIDARIIVETGLSRGDSTNNFLETLSRMEGDRELHTYEINIGQEACLAAIARIDNAKYKAKWILHHGNSIEGGSSWPKEKKVDLLFLDSDHSKDHVYAELGGWVPNVSEKAILLTDDACNNDQGQGARIAFESWHENHPEWKNFTLKEAKGMSILFRQ